MSEVQFLDGDLTALAVELRSDDLGGQGADEPPGGPRLPGLVLDPDGSVVAADRADADDDVLAGLDVVVASVHNKLAMDAEAMTARMVRAIANPHVDILGHCTGRLVAGDRGTRPPSHFDAEVVFEACRQFGVAVEINARPERQDPPDDLLALAASMGCLFSIDTDAHAPGQLEFVALGASRAEAAGIAPERIVGTWPVERLRSWAADHQTVFPFE